KQKMPLTGHVLLRSLTYSAKEGDIRVFLDGIPVANNGQPCEECYCKLPSKQEILKGLKTEIANARFFRHILTVSVDDPTNLKRVDLVTDGAKVIRLR
ncbi:hypothetical protein Angca_001273, partial [Angiostrongylus cantonensis]